MWELSGLTADQVKAGVSEVGRSLAWPPATNFDLLINFLEVYASWYDVGAVTTAVAGLGFSHTIVERLGGDRASAEETARLSKAWNDLATAAISIAFAAEAMIAPKETTVDEYVRKALDRLRVALRARATSRAERAQVGANVSRIAKNLLRRREYIQANRTPGRKLHAWRWMRNELRPLIEKANRIPPAGNRGAVRFYSPPAVTHRIASRMHPKHPRVTITEVCTVVPRSQTRRR